MNKLQLHILVSRVLAPQQVSRFLLFVRSHCSETIQYACSKLDQLCALQCHHNNLDHVLSYRTQSEDTPTRMAVGVRV